MTCITLLGLLACGCVAPRRAPEQGNAVPVPVVAPSPEVAPAAPPDPAARFIDAATAMLGQPYRYGGAAPGGFDCSGLVNFAARATGLALPRTTQELLTVGEPVPLDGLQPGDLVFMHLAAKELHVGIAVDPRRFVHAPSSGGVVRIDSLDAPPYAKALLGARRLRFRSP